MRHLGPISAALVFSAAIALASAVVAAQQTSPPPAQQPPAAPPRPYKPLALTLPAPVSDPTLDAFREQLAAVAHRKDRAALARMVVAKGFFWEREDGRPAPKKSGIDILAQAVNLAAKDGSGWDALANFAHEATAAPLPERQRVLCAPASPSFDERELEELAQTTQTDPLDWGYPLRPDVEMRETPSGSAPAIEKLGMHFIRVLDDDATANSAGEWLRVVAPSGKVGFIPADTLSSLASAQLCYVKEGNAWKIGGLVGGGE